MSQKNKKEKKSIVPASKSAVRRGEQEESKVGKILTGVGLGVLMALVVGLIIALIVTSVIANRTEDQPFEEKTHISYDDLESVVIDKQIAALNEKPSSRDAYQELIKNKTYIIFYRSEDLKNESFVDLALEVGDEDLGVLFFNLTLNQTILGDDDPILNEIEWSDSKLLPFIIVVSKDGTEFEFVGEMVEVIKLLEK